jgi:hypothetical protein
VLAIVYLSLASFSPKFTYTHLLIIELAHFIKQLVFILVILNANSLNYTIDLYSLHLLYFKFIVMPFMFAARSRGSTLNVTHHVWKEMGMGEVVYV